MQRPLPAQAYTCPEDPDWTTVACSFHAAFTPAKVGARSYNLREARPHSDYSRYVLEIPLATNIELLVWNGHYSDNEHVARMMARSIATLPPVVLHSLPENTLVSLNIGSPGGAVYVDLADIRAHAIEFQASFAYPTAETTDWSFEELLLHEIAHALDAVHGISSRRDWTAAVRMDRTEITEYAENSQEKDFAESFAAWVAVRTDSARSSRRLTDEHYQRAESRIRNRMEWFDQQLIDAALSPSGRLFHGLGWAAE